MGGTGSAGLALVLLLAAYELGDLGRVDAVEVQVYLPGAWQRWRLSAVRKDPGHYQRSFSFLPGISAIVELDQTGRSALTRCVCESPACVTCWRSWSLRGTAKRPEPAGGNPGRLEADRAEQKRLGRR